MRCRQLLLEEREPGRAGAVHLQPHRRPRGKAWGEGTLVKVADPKSVLVIGGGPAGLEYAREWRRLAATT